MVVNSWFRNFGVHGMAEKDFSIDNNNAAPDSQLVLKKRARRRLVGAIALAWQSSSCRWLWIRRHSR